MSDAAIGVLLPRLGETRVQEAEGGDRGAEEQRRRADRGEGDVGHDQERDGDARDLIAADAVPSAPELARRRSRASLLYPAQSLKTKTCAVSAMLPSSSNPSRPTLSRIEAEAAEEAPSSGEACSAHTSSPRVDAKCRRTRRVVPHGGRGRAMTMLIGDRYAAS